MAKVAIIGSRTFTDYDQVKLVLSDYLGQIDLIVSGGAIGADALAERFASEHSIPTQIFKAEWHRYGKAAGMIRNKDIVNAADVVFAFWDGKSKGTEGAMKLAKAAKKKVVMILV